VDVLNDIDRLFQQAKAADEFEFCCTILRVRGFEVPGWDPLQESIYLINQIMGLIDSQIQDSLKTRLILLLYCHVTEMNDLYNIIGNLVRIASHNDRYSMMLFPRSIYPREKIAEIQQWANGTPFGRLAIELESMLVKQVRNAFFHSDYALTPQSFNLRNNQFVEINGIRQQSVPLEWLQTKVNTAINITRHVIDKTIESIRSYKESKIVKGRFGPNDSWMDLQLTVNPNWGLTGFKSPPGV
jgi:hypothetical protein